MRVMSDPDVYALEMETIFQKTWIFLGHETEIPKSGDFVTRKLGNDAVIVARASTGDIHVSLNVCPHRGMRVCSVDSGNSPHAPLHLSRLGIQAGRQLLRRTRRAGANAR